MRASRHTILIHFERVPHEDLVTTHTGSRRHALTGRAGSDLLRATGRTY